MCASHFAYAQSTVNVRSGVHDRYNRLVFDWTDNVTYKMAQNNSLVVVDFSRKANANFKAALATKTPLIRNLSQTETDSGLRVTFEIAENTKVQGFPVGTKLAFDVLKLDNTPVKFSQATQPSAPPVAAVAPAAGEVKPQEKPADAVDPVTVTSGPQKPIKLPDLAPAEKAKNDQPPAAASPQFRTLADALENKPPEEALEGNEPAPAPVVSGTVIRLQPNEMTRFAAFERSGNLWLVIDRAIPNLLPRVEGERLAEFQNVRRIDGEKSTAFVFDAPTKDVVYSIKRDKNEWQLWLNSAEKPYLPMQMPVTVATDTVSLYAGESPRVVSLKDSQLGDTIWVVPARAPEVRVAQQRDTTSYQLIPTLIGAAIIPRSDVLRAKTTSDMVVLTSIAGQSILISSDKDRETGSIDPKMPTLFLLDVVIDRNVPNTFRAKRQVIETKLSTLKDPKEIAAKNIDLARVYLKEGFGQEALGILRIALTNQPRLESDPIFRSLRGMAASLSGEIEMAEYDLTYPEIQSHPLAKLWLGYAYAQNNQWVLARSSYIESGSSELTLPKKLQPPILLSKSETALQAEDLGSAQQLLKILESFDKLSSRDKTARDYMKAKLLVGANKGVKSIALYESMADNTDQLYRVKSEKDLIEQQLKAKEIDLEEAIDRMERLRFSWRGDQLEIDILEQLGQYYLDDKKYMDGLTVWREGASRSKDAESTDRLTRKMQDVFKNLYVDGKSDKLQPLQAVAIFQKFKELTPLGEDGNIAIRRLADRLIGVDLLDQADSMLQSQLMNHAGGVDALRIGAKLASVRIKNTDPLGAIKALDESTQDNVDAPELQAKRLVLRARALADKKKADEALHLLASDNSVEASALKADINWRESRWPAAAASIQTLIAQHRDKGETAVDGPIGPLVLKMAIAMTLDDNQKGIELLITEYGGFMAQTKQSEAFNLITKRSRGSGLADLDTLKNQVTEVELYEKFLKDF
jgi:hypothetical protein